VSAEVGMVKPDPQIYKYAAKHLDIGLSECVFVDDNHGYCEIASSLGMKTIIYRDFKQFKAELVSVLSQE
jgi:HAD superfamily hydrolase (TIGR01509 family)